MASKLLNESEPLDPLPLDLQREVLRRVPWSARVTCKALRADKDDACNRLQLRWPEAGKLGPSQKELHAFLARLPMLEHLDAAQCPRKYLAALALPSLTELELQNYGKADPGSISTSLECVPQPGLSAILPLKVCVRLKVLSLANNQLLISVKPLAACTDLTHLDLSHCLRIDDLSALAACTSLACVDLSLCIQLQSLAPLSSCAALKSLSLSTCMGITDVSALASCKLLQFLNMDTCSSDIDLRCLAACSALTTLELSGRCVEADLLPVLPALASLKFTPTAVLPDLSVCKALTALNIDGCNPLFDLSPIVMCTRLRTLDIAWCNKLTDVSPLALCPSIRSLHVHDCFLLTDFNPLAVCTWLTSLKLSSRTSTGRAGIERLKAVMPDMLVQNLAPPMCTSLSQCDEVGLKTARCGLPGVGLDAVPRRNCQTCIGYIDSSRRVMNTLVSPGLGQ